MGNRGRTVFQRPDGTWANKRHDAARASTVHDTQGAAAAAARRMLEHAGGGELVVKGRDGTIRSKDTIGHGNDPRSIRDTEH
jgi:hypothetical protein